jgi:hypothetical protein
MILLSKQRPPDISKDEEQKDDQVCFVIIIICRLTTQVVQM